MGLPVAAIAAIGIAQAGSSLLSSAFGVSAERKAARAQARALTQEKAYNLGVMRQEKVDQYWSNEMSLWRSGLSTIEGTSANTIIENNQAVLQRNIDFQEQQYNQQISAAKKAAKRKFMGVF